MRFRVGSLWSEVSGLLLAGLVLLICVSAAADTVSHEHHGCAALASEKMGLLKASPTLWGLPAGSGVVLAQLTPSEPSPAEEFPDPVPTDFRDTLSARSPPVRL